MSVCHRPVRIGSAPLAGVLTLPSPQAGPAQPLAVLAHGGPGGDGTGPAGLFVELAEALARAGIASLRFDFQGAGASGGVYAESTPSSQLLDLRDVLRYARDQGFDRVGLVGESFGATIAILAAGGSSLSTVVLLWPAIHLLDGAFAPWTTPERQREIATQGFLVEDGIAVGAEFVAEIQRIGDVEDPLRQIAPPVLLIHGDGDTVVPVRQSHRAHELLPESSELVVVPGGDHGLSRADERPLVIDRVTRWLSGRLVELPMPVAEAP